MDLAFEFIFELIVELGFEIACSKKVNKFIRYPILILYILFFNFVIFLMLFLGVSVLKDSLIGGIFIISLSLLLLTGSIFKIKKVYLEKFRSKLDGKI